MKETTVAVQGNIDGEQPSSTLGALSPPPIFLGGPNSRNVTQSSATTSFDQPFYTPLEGPSFANHTATELSAAPLPLFDNGMRNITSELTHMSSDGRLPMSVAPHQTISPQAMTLESDDDQYHNLFTSEAGRVVEDTGVGFMSITIADTSLPVSRGMSGSNSNASNVANDSVGEGTTPGLEAGNGYAQVGSVLVAIQDFVARSSDEITLAKGDRIVLVERDNKYNDGWFIGQHTTNGKIGLFPESKYKSLD